MLGADKNANRVIPVTKRHNNSEIEEACQWDPYSIRGAVLAVRILRDKWRHSILLALGDGPRRPHDIYEDFIASVGADGHLVFGWPAIHPENVHRALATLGRMGLAEHATGGLVWRRTALGDGLVSATGQVRALAEEHYPLLVGIARAGRPAVTALPVPAACDSPRAGRRASVIVFGIVLRTGWTMTTLAALSQQPADVSELLVRVGALGSRLVDVKPGGVTASSLYRRLPELASAGLVGRSAGRPPTVWELSPGGAAVLAALEPVARFGMAHDGVLTKAVLAGRVGA